MSILSGFKHIIKPTAIVLVTLATVFSHGKNKSSVIDNLKYKPGSVKENEFRSLRTELLISKNEKRALSQINKLLKKYRNTPMEPDLLLRKAELYVRRAKSERFLELNRDSKNIISWAPKRVRKASSKKYMRRAISIYDRIIAKYKYFDKIDMVIFNNAYTNQQIGKVKKAERLYWKLIKEYHGSPLTPDSHLAIGEMAFKQKRFKSALDHFNAIKKYPQSRVYPYGLYKSAWTHYNLQDATSALKALEKVVVYGRYVEEQKIDARLDLRKEALGDMTLFFSEVLPSSRAYDYFKKQAGTLDAAPYVLKLAKLYERHSKYNDKTVVLKDFINNERTSTYLPKAYEDIAKNYETLKIRPKVVATLGEFYELCNSDNTWSEFYKKQYKADLSKAKKGQRVENLVDSCKNKSQIITLNYASKWQKYWKKYKKEVFANSSESAFEIYLKYNLKTQKFYDAQSVYADLLFQRKKYRRASEQYYSVAVNTKNKKQAHDTSYSAIIALEKDVKDKWNDKDEKTFVELANVYFKGHPNAKYTLDLKFKIAFIAYQKERYSEAAPKFLEIGKLYSKTKKGQKAQDLYLDILNIQKDYETLMTYTKSLMKGMKNIKRATKLQKIYEESYFVRVQKQEESEDYKEAIAGYLSFYKENPKSKLSTGALWNVVNLSYKTGKSLDAAKWSMEFYNKYPKHKNALGGLSRAAETYEDMGQLNEAAKVAEKLAVADKKDQLKWNNVAAGFYKLERNYHKARKLYYSLWKANSKDFSFNALLNLKEIEKNSKRTRKYEFYLEEISKTGREPYASDAKYYYLEKMYKRKKFKESFQYARKIIAAKKNGANRSTVAKARFIQAQILEKEFVSQSLKTSVDRFALVLELKTAKLAKAQEAYQATIKIGDPETTVHALRRLAHVYRAYSEALTKMPNPRGLAKNEVGIFREEINRIAIPMEEKYVETLQNALSQAVSLGLQDGSVGQIQAELNNMNTQISQQPVHTFNEPTVVIPVFKGVGS